jgi:hypothetical protein
MIDWKVQCRCKLCQAWFPFDQLLEEGGRKVCPSCHLAEGVVVIRKEATR